MSAKLDKIRKIRNLGIIAHIDAGKTTLSERILFYSQKIHRMGEVHDGAATMDYLPEEQERGITIMSACTSCHWQGHLLNIIDTPGHVDFTIEVERCLRVLDGAVGVFCAVSGVEPQSETVWRQSEEFKIPKLAFINKIDRLGANFASAFNSLQERLNANPVALTVPWGEGENIQGVLDLLDDKFLSFDPEDQGRTIHAQRASPEQTDYALPWRQKLLEKLAEADDDFLPLWLDGKFSLQDIHKALRRATLARKLTPVFCGSALRNMGIQPLLDGICAYLPSPLDCGQILAHDLEGQEFAIEPDPEAKPLALVFKILVENNRKLAFLRLYSGRIHEGDNLENANNGEIDRAGRIFRLHADRREQLAEISAGEIAAVIGLRSSQSGQSYGAPHSRLMLEPIRDYPPVLTLALEPLNANEGNILDEALKRYLAEDPTLKLSIDEDSGLRMLSGMGELHLDVLLERMRREYGISPRTGQAQVVLRETVLAAAEAEASFDRELGKERHIGLVALKVEPLARGSGTSVRIGDFLPKDTHEAGKIIPQALIKAALEGVENALQCGDLTGWPLTDLCVTITHIERSDGQSTVPGTRMAAAQALREALAKASPIALEPLMRVEINVPDDFLGAVIGLLTSCGGKIEELEDRNGQKQVRASAPMRRLFGFATSLRSVSQGRAGLMLSFERFDVS